MQFYKWLFNSKLFLLLIFFSQKSFPKSLLILIFIGFQRKLKKIWFNKNKKNSDQPTLCFFCYVSGTTHFFWPKHNAYNAISYLLDSGKSAISRSEFP